MCWSEPPGSWLCKLTHICQYLFRGAKHFKVLFKKSNNLPQVLKYFQVVLCWNCWLQFSQFLWFLWQKHYSLWKYKCCSKKTLYLHIICNKSLVYHGCPKQTAPQNCCYRWFFTELHKRSFVAKKIIAGV